MSLGIAEGVQGKVIAERIGRCPSMVSREIARHGGRGRYRAARAGRAARRARRRPKRRRMDVGACLRLVVVELLKQGWSPQQVAGRSPIDHPADQHVHVSHEAIYGWIYALPKGGLGRWCPMLRSGRTRCRPVRGHAPRAPRIRGIRWIGDRSADAIGRQDPGHWGGGSPVGNDGRTAVGAGVAVCGAGSAGRTGRHHRVRGRHRPGRGLPDVVRRSLTWDCGPAPARTPTAGYGSISPKAPRSPKTGTTCRPSPANSTPAPRHLRIQEVQRSLRRAADQLG